MGAIACVHICMKSDDEDMEAVMFLLLRHTWSEVRSTCTTCATLVLFTCGVTVISSEKQTLLRY